MKSTRQHLLDILKNKPNCTAAELSRAMQLTKADVRHHLSNMVAEGLIVVTGHLHSGRRGRPARQFSIAAEQDHNFDLLSSALLAVSLQNLSPSGQSAYFKQGQLKSSMNLDTRLVGRLMLMPHA
jgi:predicted ArsR family transcriptional regulator